MNEYLEAIILGIVQGLTEFLPVSSDGHLELAKWLLGDTHSASESFFMTVILHFGTALAIVWVFRKSIWEILKNINTPASKKFILLTLISMIPAVIVGLGFESQMTALFDKKIVLVGMFLFINGVILTISDYLPSAKKPITPIKALAIGVAQAIAILPGISRSGSTIATSVGLGIDRKEAAHFSFLIVIPLIFGKIAKDIMDGTMTSTQVHTMPLFVGFLVSFFVGILACGWMIKIVQKAKLRYFGFYCMFIGIAAIIVKLWIWPN
ncbi:MAG: undecaprenyl-diphosphate phosphatase [Bacteroidota bacterium]|nr:undecaprenyl-diphosphate phosphatase [Bacteroidota bacterium]